MASAGGHCRGTPPTRAFTAAAPATRDDESMTARLLADVVLVAHLAFILFVVAGGLLAWRHPRIAWLHLPALAWATYVELASVTCPLTPLEVSLRRAAGGAGYSDGFIEHYLVPIVYPPGLTPRAQTLLGVALIALNMVLYGALAVRARRNARDTAARRARQPGGTRSAG